ncbi:hypothetical protein BDZ97DRAFT_1790157 [Flammula alnicola]|nr:hypothetical protein BDZ97DRAFT_1790157 [Flammula alnicola]
MKYLLLFLFSAKLYTLLLLLLSTSVKLANTGTESVSINYSETTETSKTSWTTILKTNDTYDVKTSAEDITIETGDWKKTLATINYSDDSSFKVTKGDHVDNTEFTLTITMKP